MAEPPAPDTTNQVGFIYPDPPAFWRAFTPANVARYAELQSAHAVQHDLDPAAVTRLPDVPPELTSLNPPAPPPDGQWRSYAETLSVRESPPWPACPSLRCLRGGRAEREKENHNKRQKADRWRITQLDDKLQSLEAAGIERLVPAIETDRDGKHTDRAFELKRLAKSIMLNYLELMGIMGCNPSQVSRPVRPASDPLPYTRKKNNKALLLTYTHTHTHTLQGKEKIQDLKVLFLNFHHIVNEYRPHQARESLIALMQDQLDAKRAETAAVRGVIDRAKRILEGLNSMDAAARERGRQAAERMAGEAAEADGVDDGVDRAALDRVAAVEAEFA